MTTRQLVCHYLRLRGELAAAYAAEGWQSCRIGHIERLSRQLAPVERALDEAGVDDDFYIGLVAGRIGWRGTPSSIA